MLCVINMSENNENKKYTSFRIPGKRQPHGYGVSLPLPKSKPERGSPLSDGMFYELEYDSRPVQEAGKSMLNPQKIVEPQKDEIRDLFIRMRDIARIYRSENYASAYSAGSAQGSFAAIFHQQGMFMKDFEDNYTGNVQYLRHFPSYQIMGYEQLRTYFTWRTGVRKGNIADTSLSYAFLYIYELLGNIGVTDPQDGLDKLMSFWLGFRIYNDSIDKYVLRWLKDYHIYYALPQSFKAFTEKYNLTKHYPKMAETDDRFDLYCAISKYDIMKSAFFTDETSKMITDCFSFVIERIRQEFEAAGMHFDDAFFRPTRKIVTWQPFRDALFYHWVKQPDRRVVLSENEIYICSKNVWTSSTMITSEKGKQFIGYVMKQMEAILRKVTKYRFKINANINMINEETVRRLTKSGIFIEKIVSAAVTEFYADATRTVVTVDHASLARIRQEALVTQEALTVEEPIELILPAADQSIFADSADIEPAVAPDGWESLKDVLNENELQALKVILQGEDIKTFAAECGTMPEVLIDGINEKAIDYIGDNLMDEDFVLYDDYKKQVKELVR